MEKKVFCYGTLQLPEVLGCLLERVPNSVPAILPGYRIRTLKERVYPGILRTDDDEKVPGILLLGISQQEEAILDRFEDVVYSRAEVTVLTDSRECEAKAYVIEKDDAHLMSEHTWNLEVFRRQKLDNYLDGVTKFKANLAL